MESGIAGWVWRALVLCALNVPIAENRIAAKLVNRRLREADATIGLPVAIDGDLVLSSGRIVRMIVFGRSAK